MILYDESSAPLISGITHTVVTSSQESQTITRGNIITSTDLIPHEPSRPDLPGSSAPPVTAIQADHVPYEHHTFAQAMELII